METNFSASKNQDLSTPHLLRSGNKTISLQKPVVMGILNISSDSFYDGAKYTNIGDLIKQTSCMLDAGAGIIDIGAVSSRPYAAIVSEAEEKKRLIPVVKAIRKEFSRAFISVDTWRSAIAKIMIDMGADMINDISGGTFDGKMPEVIAAHNVPCVLMHIKGNPQNMQDNPQYADVIKEITTFFENQIKKFTSLGANQLVLDPGFGFGKTLKHNYRILQNLSAFGRLGYPILAGMSRKSMLNKLLGITPHEALNASTVVHTIALMKGANILRVHDVKEAMEAIKIVNMLED